MNNPKTHPMKRFLLWLSGAPASPSTATLAAAQSPAPTASQSTAPAPAQTPTAEPVEPAVAAPLEATAIPDKGMPGDGLPAAVALTAVASATTADAAAPETLNDATAYGVAVIPADLPAGTLYWRTVLVHHLTPDENHANHHIFVDALDEQGARIMGLVAGSHGRAASRW